MFRKTRSNGYKILRVMNDINAISKGKILQRVGRRFLGRMSGKGINGIFKNFK